MLDFLGKVYEAIFGSWLFSDAMSDYLWGYGLEGDDTIYLNKYVLFWAIALSAGFLVSLLYYKIIDKDSWAKLWTWLLVGLGGGLLVMLCTTSVLWDQWNTLGTVLNLMSYDSQGEQMIDFIDLLGAGLSQFLLTILFYFLFSLLLKRKSYNCRYIPF